MEAVDEENNLIDAAKALMEEFDYSKQQIIEILESTLD